jgi:hypothetical protein
MEFMIQGFLVIINKGNRKRHWPLLAAVTKKGYY